MTISEAIRKGMIDLKNSNIDEPNLKARLLMQYVLNVSRQYIIIHDKEVLSKEKESEYFEGITNLRKGIPIEHITHQKEFMKLTFFVDKNVLIPRQDTEILVEQVIKIIEKFGIKNAHILDLCTGSGAIAVSLAKYINDSKIVATDISDEALKVAKKNAINNNVENQITFIKSDLFENIPNEKFDVIVSNPPYIRTNVIETLEKQVQKEPRIALDGGIDGLKFYRKIANTAYQYMKFNSYLCLEIGYDQKDDVVEILENSNFYDKIYVKKDYGNNYRAVIATI